ncbi:MAG: SDR family NAD(P)-dependent oxidoreductase [Pseudomonadota bacterium]
MTRMNVSQNSGAAPVVLVCGVSGGLGRVLAGYLHEQGLQVYGTLRNLEASQLDPAGEAYAYPLLQMDVSDEGSVDACIAEVFALAGRVDVVINCFNEMTLGSVQETSIREMTGMFDVNLFGVMRVCRSLVPRLVSQGNGCIINISSLGGVLAVPYLSGYVASKFALEAYSEALYHEVRAQGVDVVVMQPVAMAMARADTGSHLRLAAAMTAQSPAQAMAARMAADSRSSRFTPQQVAAAILKVIRSANRPFKVPLDKARGLGLVKRLVPQAALNKMIDGLLGGAHNPDAVRGQENAGHER